MTAVLCPICRDRYADTALLNKRGMCTACIEIDQERDKGQLLNSSRLKEMEASRTMAMMAGIDARAGRPKVSPGDADMLAESMTSMTDIERYIRVTGCSRYFAEVKFGISSPAWTPKLNAETMANRRLKFRSAGMCAECGGVRDPERFVLCQSCRADKRYRKARKEGRL